MPFVPLRPGGATALPLRGYRQVRSYSCGFASALMVVRYFGLRVSGEELYARLKTDRSGTRQTSLVRSLRDLGLRVNLRYDMSFHDVGRVIEQNKLIIGYLHDAEHWLVLYGYARGPERVYVADPRPQTQCEYAWETYGERLGGFGMICSHPTVRAVEPPPAPDGQLTFGFTPPPPPL